MTAETLLQAARHADYGFQNIPIIDMKEAANPDLAVRRQLANAIRDACINVGFFYVKNHGIPEEDINDAIGAGKKFFALPVERKLEYDVRKSATFKGYNPLLSENNDPNNNGDLHEGFNIGPEFTEDDGKSKSAMSSPNVWPHTDVPDFRDRVLKFYNDAVELGKKLFPLFALALDLNEDFFVDKTKESAAIMRVIHYPPQTGPQDERIVGIGAHTEYDSCSLKCFTILWQEPGIQALQVLNANNEWISAPPIPGTLVINLGDQLARWTNDVFTSTVHRAINRTGAERHSMPLFFGVDYNVKLEAIPTCVSAERPAKYDVVLAGDYVKSRLDAAYGHKK